MRKAPKLFTKSLPEMDSVRMLVKTKCTEMLPNTQLRNRFRARKNVIARQKQRIKMLPKKAFKGCQKSTDRNAVRQKSVKKYCSRQDSLKKKLTKKSIGTIVEKKCENTPLKKLFARGNTYLLKKNIAC